MKSNNEVKIDNYSNYEKKDSNNIVIEVDKPVPKEPDKIPKNKVFKQIPIEESIEQFEIVETRNNNSNGLNECLNYLDEIDKKISKPLQTYSPNFAIECIFFIFAKLFNNGPVITYLSILLILYFLKYIKFSVFFIPFFHVIMGGIFTYILKAMIGRNRPPLISKRYFNFVRNKETSKSMPSGDSLQAGIFVMIFILYFNDNRKYLSLLLIPMVMCSRIYFNCHYWFDCIIGAILGIIIAFGSDFILNKIKLYKNF